VSAVRRTIIITLAGEQLKPHPTEHDRWTLEISVERAREWAIALESAVAGLEPIDVLVSGSDG
jgi:hypothetical protein